MLDRIHIEHILCLLIFYPIIRYISSNNEQNWNHELLLWQSLDRLWRLYNIWSKRHVVLIYPTLGQPHVCIYMRGGVSLHVISRNIYSGITLSILQLLKDIFYHSEGGVVLSLSFICARNMAPTYGVKMFNWEKPGETLLCNKYRIMV